MWIIRKTIKKGDYIYALVPEHPKATYNGYVLEHRIVVENSIGRLLTNNENVHHIDGNRYNNSIENLKVMTRSEHTRLHNRDRFPNGITILTCICKNCGKIFERELRQSTKNKGTKNTFCSRRCNGLYNGYKHGNVISTVF